jgi:hypothetical protein
MSFLLQVLQFAAWAFIAVCAFHQLHEMTSSTRWVERYAYVALIVSAVSGILGMRWKSDMLDCLVAVGVALFLWANRKKLDDHIKPTD